MSRLEAQNVTVLGEGQEIVVLGHGLGTDQSVWKHIVPHLVADYRLVLFDLIGAGSTNPELYDFARYSTFEGYAADLIALFEELQIESCTYVGHSVAGMIGCLASIQHPHFFSKLILLSASPRYLNDPDYFGGFDQADLDQLFQGMQANFRAWVSGFAPLVVGDDFESPTVQEFARTFFNVRPDIALHMATVIFQSDMRDMLFQVIVPCHILQSEKDLACPIAVASYLANHLGGKTVVQLIPTEGHLPQLSSPYVVLLVLLYHLALTL